MNWIRKSIVAGVAAATAAAVTIGVPSVGSAAMAVPRAFVITNDGTRMASFWTDTPEQLDWVRRVVGLISDTSVIGIDFRVQDGKFYAVGNLGGVYTISLPTGSPPGDVIVAKVSQLTVRLDGSTFGVDFNPAADRLRIVSDNGQNLRHNLNEHTTIQDRTLTTSPSPSPAVGVSAVAYTNNDLDNRTATTLFDINTLTDQIVIQSPANDGLLVPTGFLGIDLATNAGMDIYSDLEGGKTTSNTAFVTGITNTGDTALLTVDPLTGTATTVGLFPLPITDISVQLDTN